MLDLLVGQEIDLVIDLLEFIPDSMVDIKQVVFPKDPSKVNSGKEILQMMGFSPDLTMGQLRETLPLLAPSTE